MADIDDEELIRRAEEKAELDQRERRAKQQQQEQESEDETNQPRQQARSFAKQQATQAAKKVAKSYAKKLIWSTAPYWGPVLAIVLLVGFILMFVVVGVPLIACSYSESTSGLWMKASLSSIIGVGGAANFSWDYAKAKFCPPPISYQSGGGGGGSDFCPDPAAIARQNNEPFPARNAPELDTLISCVNSRIGNLIDQSQLYSFDRDYPLCNYTRGKPICTAKCSHKVNSCHYGGPDGSQGALGVDFNAKPGVTEQTLNKELQDMYDNGNPCKFGFILFETDHTHVSTLSCTGN